VWSYGITLLKHYKHILNYHSQCYNGLVFNYKVYVYIVKHNYVLGGMVFTICKAQLHVLATNVGHLQIVQ